MYNEFQGDENPYTVLNLIINGLPSKPSLNGRLSPTKL